MAPALITGQDPTFTLSVAAPEEIGAVPGTSVTFEAGCQLTTEGLTGSDSGAQAWSVSVTGVDCVIQSATTAGTVAATTDDTPPGLRAPDDSFEDTTLIDPEINEGRSGAVSAVILSFKQPLTSLPPEGTQTILALTAEASLRSGAGSSPSSCRIRYEDGLVGGGEPVLNRITWERRSRVPEFVDGVVRIRPERPAFTLSAKGPSEVSGAAGGEVTFDSTARITTADTPDGASGIQAWSVAIAGENCEVTGATVAGTAGDLTTADPPGYRDPANSFEFTALADPANNGGKSGVTSAVVLSTGDPTTSLPTEGTEDVLVVTCRADVPDYGRTTSCRLFFVDGLVGAGQPVRNRVTWQQGSYRPDFEGSLTVVSPEQPMFSFGFDSPGSVEGQVDETVEFDLAATITTEGTPSGEPGAQAWSLGIETRDCVIEAATTDGTAAASRDDTPAGLVGDNGFAVVDVLDDGSGVVSAVVLGFEGPDAGDPQITLPSEGTETVLAITASTSTPPARQGSKLCTLRFRDGLAGVGAPVVNKVTWQDFSSTPSLETLELPVSVLTPAFKLGFRCAGSAVTSILETTPPDGAVEPTGAQAWSLSIAAEGGAIQDATTDGTEAGTLGDNGFATVTVNGDGSGVVSGVVLGFEGPNVGDARLTLPAEGTADLLAITTDGSALLVYQDGANATGPGVENKVTWESGSFVPVFAGCLGSGEIFARGDADSNSSVELTDGIVILNWLFLGASEPRCLDAADTDDSGDIDLTDAIKIFNWLFLGGTAPVAPSPSTGSYLSGDCGADPTDDALDCGVVSVTCGG